MWENLFLVITQFVTNVQLKYLTHKFCSWISFHKLYKEGAFFYVHIKIHVLIWLNSKKFNPKEKIFLKIKIFTWLLFYPPTYLPT